MKKYLLTFAMGLLLALALAPAAFAANQDTTDLQNAIDGANGTLTLNRDYNIDATINITDGITINGNGHSITYTATETSYAMKLSTNDAVVLDDVDLNATFNGGRGIELATNKPSFTLKNSVWNVNNRGIGFYNDGTDEGAVVTVDNSTIQNSQKPVDKTYENWSHQGDSRGIGFWNNEGITVNINNSAILGFGYPLNLVGDENGGRDMMDSTINITSSDIWGWCALNIWTIDATYNITNSDLKGYVETDNSWNSFATIVLNEDIYAGILNLEDPDEKANVFNITGGSVSSNCVSNNESVFHCLFRLDKEFMSRFNFKKSGRTPVALYCSSPYSAFVATYEGMEMDAFTDWAANKLTGAAENTTYNWEAIAPGVNAPSAVVSLMNMVPNNVDNMTFAAHEGGQRQ